MPATKKTTKRPLSGSSAAKTSKTKTVKYPISNQNRQSKDMAQVIALLEQLGTRLIRSEKEREELKQSIETFYNTIEDVEGRTDNAEKAYLTLQAKMRQTENTAEDIRALYEEQKEKSGKVERVIAIADRIENAIEEQMRMTKRLDRFTEDRNRLDEKILLIEESVANTESVLQSNMLVPLGTVENQGVKAHTKSGLYMTIMVIVLLLTTLITGGLYLNETADLSRFISIAKVPASVFETTELSAPKSPVVAEQNIPAQAQIQNQGQIESQTLRDRFENDPDALAASLNALEPSTVIPEDNPLAVAQPSVSIQSNNAAFNLDIFLKSEQSNVSLNSQLSPDPNLPAIIKDIENKAFSGLPTAQHDLGVIYSAGHGDIPVDFQKAFIWFKAAALQGVANARYNLGVLYHQGLGTSKNIDKAMGWYRAAAALDHADAQYNLGIAHIEGIGASYNPQAAATYFENAANAGVMEAAYNLGLIYENGLLGAPNPKKAIYWFKNAADKDSAQAKVALEDIQQRLGMSDSEIEQIYAQKKTEESGLNPISPAIVPLEETRAIPAGNAPLQYKQTTVNAAINDAYSKQQQLVMDLQTELMKRDLYPGPVHGNIDQRTEEAIMSYQADYALPQDGRVSQELLVHMISNGVAQPAYTAQYDHEYGSRE